MLKFLAILFVTLNLNAQIVLNSSNGMFDAATIEKATRGGVLETKGKKNKEELRLVCINEVETEQGSTCETYNFFVSSSKITSNFYNDRLIERSYFYNGRLIGSFPISQQKLNSVKDIKNSIKQKDSKFKNDLDQFSHSYSLPGAIALTPIMFAQVGQNPAYLLLMPASIAIGAAALLPSTIYYSISSISTRVKLNKYLESIVKNDKLKNVKIKRASFTNLTSRLSKQY